VASVEFLFRPGVLLTLKLATTRCRPIRAALDIVRLDKWGPLELGLAGLPEENRLCCQPTSLSLQAIYRSGVNRALFLRTEDELYVTGFRINRRRFSPHRLHFPTHEFTSRSVQYFHTAR
jgi:hypothetical protein